jgi:HEAT repeat protein
LARIASTDAAAQEQGVRTLIARGNLFDALQGGAPPKTRLNAIATLERVAAKGNEPKAFEQLLQMMKDPDTESAEKKTHPVRDAATAAVARVGTQYTERLLDAAKNQDNAIKDESRKALRTIGAPLQQAMATRLGDDALRAPLGDILATGVGPQTVPLMTPYLQPDKLNPDGKKKPEDLVKPKVELIEALGKYKLPAEPKPEDQANLALAARAIVPFKADPDPNVRRTVVTSLSNLAHPVGGPVLIEALTSTDTDSDARAAAAGALGAIATPEANAAMVRALSDYDRRVAVAAAAGLRRAGDKAAGAIAQVLAHPDPLVRARAADAAAGLSNPGLAIRALKDPDAGVRAAAAAAIGDMAAGNDQDAAAGASVPAGATGAAAGTTDDSVAPAGGGPNVAAVAAGNGATTPPAAGSAPPARSSSARMAAAVGPLVSALSDPDGTVANAASLALVRIGEPAMPALLNALQSTNDAVALYASRALEAIGKPAVDRLVAVANRPGNAARWAVITLGQIGDPRAASVLESLSRSNDSDTANAATIALAKVRQD